MRALLLSKPLPIGDLSAQVVPDTTAAAVLIQRTGISRSAEVLLQRIATGASQFNDLADCDAPVLAREIGDL